MDTTTIITVGGTKTPKSDVCFFGSITTAQISVWDDVIYTVETQDPLDVIKIEITVYRDGEHTDAIYAWKSPLLRRLFADIVQLKKKHPNPESLYVEICYTSKPDQRFNFKSIGQ